MEHRRAFITVADGTRLAAQLWLPDERPAPVVLEALPYRMDDLTSAYASEYERLCEEGGFAVCRLDIRGTGSSERDRDRRVHGGRARRHLPGDRVARGAGVVERPRRHVRHLLVGLQLAPGRLPAPAGAPRDRADLRLRRPLHRRRPLHGRRAQGDRPVDWMLYMVAGNALPPVPAVFGDRLARGVGAAGRRRRAVAAALARGAGRRAVLAARLGAAGLRPDHLPDDDRGRLGRRLHEHRLPRRSRRSAARSACSSAPGATARPPPRSRGRTSTSSRS